MGHGGPRWMWLYLGALEKGFALRCLRILALATGLRINCRGVRAKAGDQFRGHWGISEEGVHGLGQHGSSRGAPLVGPFFLRTVSHPESLNPNRLADTLPYKCLVLALGQVFRLVTMTDFSSTCLLMIAGKQSVPPHIECFIIDIFDILGSVFLVILQEDLWEPLCTPTLKLRHL